MSVQRAGSVTEAPAADHLETIDWRRGAWSDKKVKYSRQHLWVPAGTKLKASESGVLTGLESGDCWISEVILDPNITLKAGYEMTEATMAHLHEHVPEHCY
jgi:hypothetical protein